MASQVHSPTTGSEVRHRLYLLRGSSLASALGRQLSRMSWGPGEARITVDWVTSLEMETVDWERVPGTGVTEALLETVVAGEMSAVFVETDPVVIRQFLLTRRLESDQAATPKENAKRNVTTAALLEWVEVGRVSIALLLAAFTAGTICGVYVALKVLTD